MAFDRRAFLGGAALSGLAVGVGVSSSRAMGGGKAAQAAAASLSAYLDAHRAAWGIPGMTAVVVGRDGVEAYATSGLADLERRIPVGPDHLFQIGSVSKMFVALAAHAAIEDGKLSPDARLSDVLKGFKVRGGKAITLQHLLDHTAGLPSDSDIFPQGGLRALATPGSSWSYSNCGYDLAGKMLAAADGRPCHEAVAARVLGPLGMTRSVAAIRVADRARYAEGYEPALRDRLNPPPSTMTPATWVDSDSPAGSVAATMDDMAKFLRFLLGLAEGKGGPVFSDAAAKRFLANPVDGWGADAKYGNGVARLSVDGRNYLHHTGGMISFCSSLHLDREAGVAAFVSSNVHYSLNYRPTRASLFACDLFRALKDGAPPPAPRPARDKLAEAQSYVGSFVAADGDRFETFLRDGALFLRRKGREFPIEQASKALFATAEPDFALAGVVIERADGKPVRAYVGDLEFLTDPSIGYRPPPSEELRAHAGRYDNDDPWWGLLTVHARDGKLWIGNIEPLTPLDDGDYRYGDEKSPERVRFEGYINGRPHRLLFSGAPFVRRFS